MKLNNNFAERRTSPRVNTALPINIKTEDFDIAASTQNISRSGAYCEVKKYIAPMTKLGIIMVIKDKNRELKIKCRGVVVRTEEKNDKYNIAIYFNDIADSEKEKITKYVENLLTV
ncbi:MAG: hypothetical protein COV72_02755 [Candidatus Omnitrophica bacterium CG11_big_fil_rev_8_21_14_0_20_42_13]|uniref:PilZ domain-containing protein n=1 Tax=Candidatus Ghiorseimicrobium undicola TaxID=1974746 RepID=A0A2H0LYU8_9BACT|nr:MAG: hypothetical protein COV72_02755 [Candidatus Omnitrophica bacterium CG11_big_fil_rev_8_21_14_0_20_42_13]